MTRSAPAVPRWSNVRNGTNDGSDCLKAQCRRLGMSTACPSEETGNSSVAPCSRPMNSACARVTAGNLGERFGDQVVQMLGAAEHRSERIRACVSEERRPQQRRWAAWAPKIRRGHPAGTRTSLVARLAWKQWLADQPLIRGEISLARLRDDFVRQPWRLRFLVPPGTYEPVAHELLVVRVR